MGRKSVFKLSVFLMLLLIMGTTLLTGAVKSRYKYRYIGSQKCRECHGDKALGNQYGIWMASSHSRAYLNLTSAKALAIAGKSGIENPQNASACLSCHTTGRNREDNRILEGVGCEACHGPASEYHRPSVHVDLNYAVNGYRRAIRAGMYNILGDNRLKFREKMCLSCHSDSRPCYPEKDEERRKQKMTIQVVDSLMRGDANLRHPVRR